MMDSVLLAPPISTPPAVPLPEPKNKIWLWILGGVLLLGTGIVAGVLFGKQLYFIKTAQVDSYDQCVSAKGSRVLQTYPTICVAASGQRFIQSLTDEEKQNLIPPDLNREPTGSNPTANWKIFTDSTNKMSFKYPEAWTVSVGNSNAVTYPKDTIVIKSSPSTFDVSLVMQQSNTDPKNTLLNFVKNTLGDVQTQIISSDSSTASGYIMQNGPGNSELKINFRVISNGEKSLVAITVLQADKINIFNQILSTFKFLNNTNDGTLEAIVIRSPTCAGPITDPKSCEASVANETFNITGLSDNKNIQSVRTDKDGRFTVSLTSGSYKLQNATGRVDKFGRIGGIGKNIGNPNFTIVGGKTTTQRFDVDTGIR